MVRKFGKRALSILLAMAMVFTWLPVEALAADLTSPIGKELTVSYTITGNAGTREAKSTNGIITATATSWNVVSSQNTVTVTLKNTGGEKATLSFSYSFTATQGTCTIGGETITPSGATKTYTKELDNNSSIDVVIKNTKTKGYSISITMSNFKLVGASSSHQVTFQKPENGSIVAKGNTLTQETTVEATAEGVAVKATPSNKDYEFVAWVDQNNKILSTLAETTLLFEDDCTVRAVFNNKSSSSALFKVDNTLYDDLNKAIPAAQSGDKKIVLVGSGVLAAGSYTIPSGVTLLIPFDSAYTCYTSAPGNTDNAYTKPSVYKTLTIANGASITVNGAISVSAKHSGQQLYNGAVSGPYGYIYMNDGSSITVNNGGALYAWGYISGNGKVTAESDAAVFELMQIADYRGGTATSGMTSKKVFPFNQYYVQNIEAELELKSGANEKLYTSIYTSGVFGMGAGTKSASVDFIGNGGMFIVSNGSFTKRYVPSTDRMEVAVNGNAEIKSISLLLNGTPIDSKSFVLPITNNMTMNINSGTTEITQDVALLPGVQVNIAEDAELNVISGGNLYVYDQDQWGNYSRTAKFMPVVYSPTKSYTRKATDLIDAKINVNGMLSVNGAIYTTEGGADIISTDAGLVQYYANAGTAKTTQQVTQSGSNVTYEDITITAAKLHNADGSYTETAGSKADDYYTYINGVWTKNYEPPKPHTVIWVDEDGTELGKAENVNEGAKPEYPGDIPTKEGNAQFSYEFSGWSEPDTDEAGDVTYKATYTEVPNTYTVTWQNEDGTVLVTDENVLYGVTPNYNGATPEKAATVERTYTFAGWDKEVVSVTGDVTYTATYTDAPSQYEIRWLDSDGTLLDKEIFEYGVMPEYHGEEPTKAADAQYTYLFDGWNEEVVSVTGPKVYIAKYAETPIVYTVTFLNEDDTNIASYSLEYGASIEPVPTATKASTVDYTFEFAGWLPELAKTVTGNAEYKASFKAVPVEHKAIWKDLNSNTIFEKTFTVETPLEERTQFERELPTKEATAQYTYSFNSWDEEKQENGDIVYTPVFAATTNSYTVTFVVDDVPNTGTWEYGTTPSYGTINPVKAEETYYTYEFIGWNSEIVPVTGEATYIAQFEKVGKTGWITEENGKTYAENGEKKYSDEWAVIKDDTYYFDENGFVVTGLYKTMAQDETHEATFVFDQDGKLLKVNGLFSYVEDIYWTKDGEILENVGLVQVPVEGGNDYYYFGEDGKAAKNESFWVGDTKGYLPQWEYQFGEDGVIPHEEDYINGFHDVDGDRYYFIDGIRAYMGLMADKTGYYYVNSKGKLICGQINYWVSRTNGLLDEGSYEFDANGYIVFRAPNNGIVNEEGSLWYYVDGKRTYAGVIQIDGNYYYAKSSGEIVHDTKYWISKTNGLVPEKSYEFTADGKMVIPEEKPKKNGIVNEEGSLWYYVDGKRTYAGVIKIDGSYYYAKTSGEIVHGTKYWISKTNELVPEKSYEFGADGKMVIPEEKPVKADGIYEEGGILWYYVDGKRTYAGVIKIDGSYYYAKTSGEIVRDKKYWISKTNGLLKEKSYTFDEDGRILDPEEIK